MKTLEDVEDELGEFMFPCDCGDHQHGLVITRGDDGEVWLQIAYFPLSIMTRIRAAWKMIRIGVGGFDADIMTVAPENIEALCNTIVKASMPFGGNGGQ